MLKNLDEIVYFIVPCSMGSKVLHYARKNGAYGGMIRRCEGTINNPVLDRFCLSENKREIVSLFIENEKRDALTLDIIAQFKIEKKHRGIAFTIPTQWVEGEQTMYQLITTIVDKGVAEDVIKAATKAGSTGGTIMNARGASIYNTQRLFNMDIEPEKETVLIVASNEQVDAIVTAIDEALNLEESQSILFTQPIINAYGIYE